MLTWQIWENPDLMSTISDNLPSHYAEMIEKIECHQEKLIHNVLFPGWTRRPSESFSADWRDPSPGAPYMCRPRNQLFSPKFCLTQCNIDIEILSLKVTPKKQYKNPKSEISFFSRSFLCWPKNMGKAWVKTVGRVKGYFLNAIASVVPLGLALN